MLQTEFIKQYCENSNMTERQLFDMGLFAIPCDCEEDNCKGWAMIAREAFDFRLNLYSINKADFFNGVLFK